MVEVEDNDRADELAVKPALCLYPPGYPEVVDMVGDEDEEVRCLGKAQGGSGKGKRRREEEGGGAPGVEVHDESTIPGRMMARKRGKGKGAEEAKEEDEVIVLEEAMDTTPPSSGQRRSGRLQAREEDDEDTLMESCLTFLMESSETQFKEGKGDGSRKSMHYQFTAPQLEDLVLRLVDDELLHDEILNRAVDMLAFASKAKGILLLNTFWYEMVKDGRYREAQTWVSKAISRG